MSADGHPSRIPLDRSATTVPSPDGVPTSAAGGFMLQPSDVLPVVPDRSRCVHEPPDATARQQRLANRESPEPDRKPIHEPTQELRCDDAQSAAMNHVDSLVEEHRGLVIRIANRVMRLYDVPHYRPLLLELGSRGLRQAAHRFEPERGASFSTFAWLRIRGAMIDGLRQLGLHGRARVRPPACSGRRSTRPGESHVARGTARDVGQRAAADVRAESCRAATTPTWMSIDEDEGPPPRALTCRLTPEQLLIRERVFHDVRTAVSALAEPYRTLVERTLLRDDSLAAVARDMGRSRSWACRNRQRALSMLAEALTDYAPYRRRA